MANRNMQAKAERAKRQSIEAGVLLADQYTIAYSNAQAKQELIDLARNSTVKVYRLPKGERLSDWGRYCRKL